MIHTIHSIIGNDSIDIDAKAFLLATAITDPTIRNAINFLFTAMKDVGVYNKMIAMYPFVGGTATTHKYNAIDPQDLDASYRLTFNGGWTHSSNGALPNGTTGWANTHIVPSTVFNTTDFESCGVYLNLATNDKASGYVMGGYDGSNGVSCSLIVQRPSGLYQFAADYASSTSYRVANFTSTSSQYKTTGIYIGTQNGSHVKFFYKLNTGYSSVQDVSATLSLSKGSQPIAIGATTQGATPTDSWSQHRFAFAFIGTSLSDTEVGHMYSIIKDFSTLLSR